MQGFDSSSAEARQAVYERSRAALVARLRFNQPGLSKTEDRQGAPRPGRGDPQGRSRRRAQVANGNTYRAAAVSDATGGRLACDRTALTRLRLTIRGQAGRPKRSPIPARKARALHRTGYRLKESKTFVTPTPEWQSWRKACVAIAMRMRRRRRLFVCSTRPRVWDTGKCGVSFR
jgi:hypothetical protein